MSEIKWTTPEKLGVRYAESEFAEEAILKASWILWALSGRKYGMPSIVKEIYPATPQRTNDLTSVSPRDRNVRRYNTKIRLTGTPIHAIQSIKYTNGNVIPATDFYITNRSTLHFNYPLSGDIEIVYKYGALPPVAGQMAARALAIQFVLLWENDDECALPSRLSSVTRQGMSYTIIDSQDFISEMKTSIYEVDLFLTATNPDNARKRAKVWSPDLRRGRRVSVPIEYTIIVDGGSSETGENTEIPNGGTE